jgi:hypothetical protein
MTELTTVNCLQIRQVTLTCMDNLGNRFQSHMLKLYGTLRKLFYFLRVRMAIQ